MNWKMVFVIYVEGKEGRIELTRQKITTVDGLQFFLKNFFEEQKGWMKEVNKKKFQNIHDAISEGFYGCTNCLFEYDAG